MLFWDKNLTVIEKQHPHLLPLTPISSKHLFYMKESKFGQNIPGVIENQKNILLGSLYRVDKELETTAGHSLPLFIGILSLLYQEKSIEKMEKLILVEPNRQLFLFLIEHFNLDFILNHPKIQIYLGPSTEELRIFLERDYNPYMYGLLQISAHEPSSRVFQEIYHPVISLAKSQIHRWMTEWKTQKHFARNWFRNILHNLQVLDSSDIPKIKKKVVLLAAGPSVEEIMDSPLLQRKDQSIVIVDTLLPLAREAGIPVDFVVSLDCQISSYHHYLKGINPTTIPLMDIAVHPSLPRKAKKVFFTGNRHPLAQYLCPELAALNTGLGNVTAFAVDAVLLLGAEEIDLFGADYSFPRGKAYSRNTYLINHYEYGADRLSTLENALYSFSSRSVHAIDESRRTTARLQFYKSQLKQYLDSKTAVRYKEKEGYWKIRTHENRKTETMKVAFKSTQIKEYRERLESIDLGSLQNAERMFFLDEKDRKCIGTLFPLLTLYLENLSWQKGLKNARDWAVDQLLALEAMEA